MAKNLMNSGMLQASQWSKEQYAAKIRTAEALISGSQNSKSNTLTSGGLTPLTDVCYVYEGIFNFNFGELETPNKFLEHVEETYTVDISTDANGDYFLSNQEVIDLYAELQSTANTEVDPANSELMLFCDLRLESVDESNGTATVRASMSIALQKPVPMTPTTGYFGANLAGPCASPVSNTADAATFIDAYWQRKIKNRVQSLNSNGNGVYHFVAETWHNLNSAYSVNPTSWSNDVFPYFWKSATNDCLGNTNQEWYDLYTDSEKLAQEAIDYNVRTVPHLQLHTFEPTHVWYSSQDYGVNGMPYFPQIPYCHSGVFVIGYFQTI